MYFNNNVARLRQHRRPQRRLQHGVHDLPGLGPHRERHLLLPGPDAGAAPGTTPRPRSSSSRRRTSWYLVFQSGPPHYSTTTNIETPAGWTPPAQFFNGEPAIVTQNKGATGGWLDFWVICDDVNCYLFFSDDNGHWYRSQTAVGDFPNGSASRSS